MTPCIDLADPAVCADPLAAYRRAQAAAPVVTLTAPGLQMYAITRHREARAMLTDPRFAPSPASYAARPDVPDEYRPYLRTMQEQDGPGHLRLRRAVAPAFTPRRVGGTGTASPSSSTGCSPPSPPTTASSTSSTASPARCRWPSSAR